MCSNAFGHGNTVSLSNVCDLRDDTLAFAIPHCDKAF
jgi:hypothetical protein